MVMDDLTENNGKGMAIYIHTWAEGLTDTGDTNEREGHARRNQSNN